MPSSRSDITQLTSRALDGELNAADAAQLAASRAGSARFDDLARQIETSHAQLAMFRHSASRVVLAPAEWAEQIFGVLREQLTSRRPSRRRFAEVSARDAAHAEDLDLAQSAMAGEEQAQREIYFGHIALVQHLLQTRRLAAYRDDIAQDIFFRVFSRLHTYRGDSSLKTWIHRVAINHINNVLTRDMPKRAKELSESQLDTQEGSVSVIDAAVDPDVLQDTRVMNAERRAIVDAALARLPNAARTVVELKEIDGLTCEEIAAVLSVPMGTVQSRLARGRARLAEYLVADPRAGSAR
ncbi:MAG: sigma-70 family RNA polymerase sigma factor [Gemmatimonadaceae bacterium]|nr:sigma-70 family RNA polymerase sigma factor [Gemmatimonadaceae bacterium]